MSKERKLAVCVGTLLCLGNSLNSMAMNRSFSPGTRNTIETLYKDKNKSDFGSIFDSMKILNTEHGIKLYSYDGKKYILKKNNKGGHFAENEVYVLNLFKNRPHKNICAPIYYHKFTDNDHYAIYPYIEHVDENALYDFINYEDYEKDEPTQPRALEAKKAIWIDLVNQLTGIIKSLYKDYKIIHNDYSKDNVLFNIDKKRNKLNAILIDFDAIQKVEENAFASGSYTLDFHYFCGIMDELLLLFLGEGDTESDKYFNTIRDSLCSMRKLEKTYPTNYTKIYESYINHLSEVLIYGKITDEFKKELELISYEY